METKGRPEVFLRLQDELDALTLEEVRDHGKTMCAPPAHIEPTDSLSVSERRVITLIQKKQLEIRSALETPSHTEHVRQLRYDVRHLQLRLESALSERFGEALCSGRLHIFKDFHIALTPKQTAAERPKNMEKIATHPDASSTHH